MRLGISLIVCLLFCQVFLFGTDYLDVIYLKNGDVAKGMIVENVPNDYVKLEIPGGTILTFKYSEIERFAKEKIETSNSSNHSFNESSGLSASSDFDLDFGFKIGYYSPSEEVMQEIYGSGLFLGGGITIWKGNIGVNICIETFKKDGEPYIFQYGDVEIVEITDASCSIKILPVTMSGLYRIRSSNLPVEPYFGLGIGSFKFKEKIEGEGEYYDPYWEVYYPFSVSTSVSDSEFGFLIVAGVIVDHIFIEAKYTSATFESEGAAGEKCDIGGINISVGIKL
ncbi:MAG: outer membrane beta-barrel protein [Candidatus Marinimicrobia bacterium]|nr:outer membrane beta-barrel protein [Candidatus Neomarinimicrobiota bacterium]